MKNGMKSAGAVLLFCALYALLASIVFGVIYRSFGLTSGGSIISDHHLFLAAVLLAGVFGGLSGMFAPLPKASYQIVAGVFASLLNLFNLFWIVLIASGDAL